ncbi:hypothetical protein OROMI_024251 [Orobanche minor]
MAYIKAWGSAESAFSQFFFLLREPSTEFVNSDRPNHGATFGKIKSWLYPSSNPCSLVELRVQMAWEISGLALGRGSAAILDIVKGCFLVRQSLSVPKKRDSLIYFSSPSAHLQHTSAQLLLGYKYPKVLIYAKQLQRMSIIQSAVTLSSRIAVFDQESRQQEAYSNSVYNMIYSE